MNIAMLEQVEQWLLAGAPERTFNMNVLVDETKDKENWCGTSCCIAGYIYQQVTDFSIMKDDRHHWSEADTVVQKVLEISPDLAEKLFYIEDTEGQSYPGRWEAVTPAQAAKAVRNMIEVGTPLWETILDFEQEGY